ncbi:hypothetical protein ACX0GZ_04425 [Sphingomonas aestuarii]
MMVHAVRRHRERSEAIQRLTRVAAGLLRCARNDELVAIVSSSPVAGRRIRGHRASARLNGQTKGPVVTLDDRA